jgi:hypothetical protein
MYAFLKLKYKKNFSLEPFLNNMSDSGRKSPPTKRRLHRQRCGGSTLYTRPVPLTVLLLTTLRRTWQTLTPSTLTHPGPPGTKATAPGSQPEPGQLGWRLLSCLHQEGTPSSGQQTRPGLWIQAFWFLQRKGLHAQCLHNQERWPVRRPLSWYSGTRRSDRGRMPRGHSF